ncbi:MAG: hypothetical protein ACREE7_12750 [Dongiaceae bacterium]
MTKNEDQPAIAAVVHALRTLLGETADSDYMSGAQQQEMARKALADHDAIEATP